MAFLASGIQVHVHESKFSVLMQDSDSGEEADSEVSFLSCSCNERSYLGVLFITLNATQSWKKVGKSKKTAHSKESEGSSKAALKNAKKRSRKKKSGQLSNATDVSMNGWD